VFPAAARVEATASDGSYLVVLPPGTPATTSLQEAVARSAAGQEAFPGRTADRDRSHGLLFVTVLIVVILITSVGLRGRAAIILVIGAVLLATVLAATGAMPRIASAVTSIDIEINLAGYLFLSTALFTMWLVAFRAFPRFSVVFTGDEVRVKEEGEPERVYDARGAVVSARRSDPFRHWILGMGSGDMTVRLADGRELHFPDVLFSARRILLIQELLRTGGYLQPHS
jgi:hypothetical protein